MYECVNISGLKLEEMVGKNIALAPTSFDAMFELRLLMIKCGYTMFNQPAMSKSKIDAISRCKFDLSRNNNDKILLNAAKAYINYDTLKRTCVHIESETRHWQSVIEYYQEKDFIIIEVTIDDDYECFFDEKLIYEENSYYNRSYSKDSLSEYIDLAKKYRFGNY